MKYLFRWVSALLLGLVLSACGGSGGSGGNSGSPATDSNCTITTGFCGTLTGLPAGQTVTLYFETSDAGSGDLTLTANGPFSYGLNAAIDLSTTYGVGVVGETPETKCSVTNGGSNAYSGALKLTVISGVAVSCVPAKAYTVGGTLTGLNSGAQLPLGVNGVYSNSITLTANGAFTFPTAVTSGDPYNVTVLIQPPGQNCTVSNGTGTVGANVSNVAITCSEVYTVGGTISGLDAPAVILENNGADDLTVSANGTFTFATSLAAGATYSVTVGTQPSHEHCTVTGGSGTLSGNVDTVQVACGDLKQVLYTFTGGNDGAGPQAGVIMDGAGNLYGTTEFGGGSPHCSGGCGVVFELARDAGGGYTESVLYSFIGYGGDGATPLSGVIMDSAGNLYGTTAYAGNCPSVDGCGIVFKLAPNSAGGGYTESVLYAFSGGSDGSNPAGALLLDGAGNLYGTTPYGGNSNCTKGCGTVFKVARNGSGGYTESTLYSFGGGAGGNGPVGGLVVDSAGDLYGIVADGGSNGTGAVFELSPSGGGYTESILYNFPATGVPPNADATLIYPAGSLLIDSAGDLYGNSGTVFKLAPNGSGGYTESDLFSFNTAGSYSSLIMDSAGDLYGTHPGGGPVDGLIFALVPDGSGGYTEQNLYVFPGSTYGSTPGPGLVLDGAGNLYGTEPDGGNTQDCASNGGCGDVFEISPQ